MLEGRNVNLRIAEKEDLRLLLEWFNTGRRRRRSPRSSAFYQTTDALLTDKNRGTRIKTDDV